MPQPDASASPCRGLLRSPVNIIALGALAALLVYMFGWSANFQQPTGPTGTPAGADYLQFHIAGQLIRHGQGDRLYDFEFVKAFQHDPAVIPYQWDPKGFFLVIYPPFFAWFCLPFSCLPYHAGAVTWALVMTCFFLAALTLLLRSRPGATRCFGWALLGCLLFQPLVISIYSCQNATLSLFILTLSFALLRSGRPLAAGSVFAALAFKPQLTLVIALAMLFTRRWRFVAGALLGGLVLLAASLAVSPSATLDYLRLVPRMSKWIDMPGMPLERMTCWYGFWRLALAGQPLFYVQAATVATSILTLVPLVGILRSRAAVTSPRFALQYAALVMATVMLSPHLLSYDLTLLLLPLGVLATSGFEAPAEFSPRMLRMVACAVFVAAAVSEWVALRTGVQLVVPVLFVALVLLAKVGGHSTRNRRQPTATA